MHQAHSLNNGLVTHKHVDGWMDIDRIRNRYLLNTEEESRDGYRCIYSLNETSKLHDKEIVGVVTYRLI
jgi:hypothetical protein